MMARERMERELLAFREMPYVASSVKVKDTVPSAATYAFPRSPTWRNMEEFVGEP